MIQVHAQVTVRTNRRRETTTTGTFTNEHRWMLDGACVGQDTEMFFPPHGVQPTGAIAVCKVCPVLKQCRAYALADLSVQGVLGGLTQKQRRRHAVASSLLDTERRRTKGVNLNARIAEELRIMAATGVTVADAMSHVGWDNAGAMRKTMSRYGLSDTWAQLRRNSHTQGVRVDGVPPLQGVNGGAFSDAGETNRQPRRRAA